MTARIKHLIGAGLAAAAFCVSAAPVAYEASLSGAAESPPNASPGTGSIALIYDAATHQLDVDIVFADLVAGVTAAHIHCCTSGSLTGTAGVAALLPGFPTGTTSDSYSATLDLTLASNWNAGFINSNGGTPAGAEAAFAAALDSGRAYLNIHTSVFPGGEIRGFLVPAAVPEPMTSLLAALGVAAAASLRRRRIAA